MTKRYFLSPNPKPTPYRKPVCILTLSDKHYLLFWIIFCPRGDHRPLPTMSKISGFILVGTIGHTHTVTHTRSHTHTQSHTHSVTHTQAHTHSVSLSLTHTHTRYSQVWLWELHLIFSPAAKASLISSCQSYSLSFSH